MRAAAKRPKQQSSPSQSRPSGAGTTSTHPHPVKAVNENAKINLKAVGSDEKTHRRSSEGTSTSDEALEAITGNAQFVKSSSSKGHSLSLRPNENLKPQCPSTRLPSPRKSAKKVASYREWISSSESDQGDSSSSDESLGSLADFIVDDDSICSTHETYEAPPLLGEMLMAGPNARRRRLVRGRPAPPQRGEYRTSISCLDRPPTRTNMCVVEDSCESLSSGSQGGNNTTNTLPGSPQGTGTAILTFSPKSTKPSRRGDLYTTSPPQTPSHRKSKLASPSKRPRIPPSPHRPSTELFWKQDIANDWNDQFSFIISTSSRRKNHLVVEDSDQECPGPASLPRSPVKPVVSRAVSRKAFDRSKNETATRFLKELDQEITGGHLEELAASTGGIKLVWNKKLQSTAGRANWKRELVKQTSESEKIVNIVYKHFASIELSEKVIDSEERLINVLAHEFCHLTNFMISGVKDRPHGKDFKQWASKCSSVFSARGVHVTTNHSYTIAYKYVWSCTACGMEFKRHSKSIDPVRHACGSCSSKLVQIQPPPRAAGPPSEYQRFVKEHFGQIKRENPKTPQKDVMGLLAVRYREFKLQRTGMGDGEGRNVSEIEGRMTVTRKAEDHGWHLDGEATGGMRQEDTESVIRKLDFLNLAGPEESAVVDLVTP
ncbi:MAG: hypothetical protein M1833_001759 [Piccolia ochrophora]|nr:MAG: hypothetical protein M1833_001759 [Piccolia ochrophora]